MLNREEKTILVQSGINLDLLGYLTVQLKENPNMSLNQFHTQFMDYIGLSQADRPYAIFNQGVLLTHLYGLLIYPKEKFFNLIPNSQ